VFECLTVWLFECLTNLENEIKQTAQKCKHIIYYCPKTTPKTTPKLYQVNATIQILNAIFHQPTQNIRKYPQVSANIKKSPQLYIPTAQYPSPPNHAISRTSKLTSHFYKDQTNLSNISKHFEKVQICKNVLQKKNREKIFSITKN